MLSLLKKIFHAYKKGAKDRGLEFDIGFDFFTELLFQDCYYCGREPYQKFRFNGRIITRGGIDRKNNSIGYLESNCVPCCKECNYAKGRLSFFRFIKKIYG